MASLDEHSLGAEFEEAAGGGYHLLLRFDGPAGEGGSFVEVGGDQQRLGE